MCSVSMVGDHYRDLWKERPWWPPQTIPQFPQVIPNGIEVPYVTQAEFNELKRQVAEMKELLKRAKAYDEANGEPECEIDEKMDLLRKVAKMVGISLDDVIKPKTA